MRFRHFLDKIANYETLKSSQVQPWISYSRKDPVFSFLFKKLTWKRLFSIFENEKIQEL